MSRSIAISCALLVLWTVRGVAAESSSVAAATTLAAPQLVESALQASLAGDASHRDELLTKALDADPRYAPAQWQSGRVQFDGQWRSVEEVRDILAADGRWQDYADLKATLAGTPADHEQLARWCLRNGLEKEERFHWRNVLQANPKHEFAKSRLGVSEYRGGLYTKEQIAADQERINTTESNFNSLSPHYAKVCQRAVQGDLATRTAALEELRQTADPAALEAMEYAVEQEGAAASPEQAMELNLALIAALGNMPDHKATMRLLEYSVYSETPDIRRAAARQLTPRPMTDYVPLLMGSLLGFIKSEVGSYTSSDGKVIVIEKLHQPGHSADLKSERRQDYEITAQADAQGQQDLAGIRNAVGSNQQSASVIAYYSRRRVEAANLQIAARNERIREVFRYALEVDLGADPERYWDEWRSYNDLYESEHPTYYNEEYYSSFTTVAAPPPPPRPMPAFVPGGYECFAPGTPVWTQAGLTPIEHIAVGDMVLAQDPTTGELDYRAVLNTTLRPPTRMMRLAVAGDVVRSTLGHRFWVSGKGWEMAKHLAPGAILHAVDGPQPLDAATPLDADEASEAYNLTVEGLHTYFVGESRLLVHDNSCPQPTTALIPGYAAPAPTVSPDAKILGNVAR